MSEQFVVGFAYLLRKLRQEARLSQEELAGAAGLSTRTVSDLERGVNLTARKATAELLAGALGLSSQARGEFVRAACGRTSADEMPAGRRQQGDRQSASLAVRYSLPPDTATFIGRDAELDAIIAVAANTAERGPGIHAIDGMPGVGKTALAVRAAHLLQAEFPDRQLFVDLHGHTPGREPVRPHEALAGLLAAAGVDSRHLPHELTGRAALWRDRIAGQRALLVLDNAASSAQVAPLLPGSGRCLVLVTSRRHLGDMPGLVTRTPLSALSPQHALNMFTQHAAYAVGSSRQAAEVVRLAGFLPLGISLLARVITRHPSWTLADLAAETRAGVLTLTAESDSIAAAFDVSYRYLDAAQQRMFRLLGLHPGITTDTCAAAALAGISQDEAERLLDALHQEGLLTETGYRRYGVHDLLRRYARDLSAADRVSSRQAVDRLLDYYISTAARAEARLTRHSRPGPPEAGILSAAPELRDAEQALTWIRADRASLLACLDHVTGEDQHTRVVALTAALAAVLRRDGPWADAITRHATAVQAAQLLGDRLGEANALDQLGNLRQLTNDYPAAALAHQQALDIYRSLGNRLGEANALNKLGAMRWQTADYPAATQALDQALSIYHEIGDRLGQANALSSLGTICQLTGDHSGAGRAFTQALSVYRDLGDRLGEANALSSLGDVQNDAGDLTAAALTQQEALGIYRSLGDRLGEANALNYLGIVRWQAEDYPAAVPDHEQALDIYRSLGNQLGEANALSNLGNIWQLTGDLPAAAIAQVQALSIYRNLGNRFGEGNALNYLGVLYRRSGDFPEAMRAGAEALAIFSELGNRAGQVEALNEIATLHWVKGDLVLAQSHYQQALDLAHAIASSAAAANALTGLGRCAKASGDLAGAGTLLRQALEILQRAGGAGSGAVLTELGLVVPSAAT